MQSFKDKARKLTKILIFEVSYFASVYRANEAYRACMAGYKHFYGKICVFENSYLHQFKFYLFETRHFYNN